MYTFIILIFIRVEFTFYMLVHVSEIQESDFLFRVKSTLNSQDTNNNMFLLHTCNVCFSFKKIGESEPKLHCC